MNKDKALELITEAAEEGLLIAQRQLITMYNEGIGVQRSTEEVLKWRERLSEALKKSYFENRNELVLYEALEEALKWADDLISMGSVVNSRRDNPILSPVTFISCLTFYAQIWGANIHKCTMYEVLAKAKRAKAYSVEGHYCLAADCYKRAWETIAPVIDSVTNNDILIRISEMLTDYVKISDKFSKDEEKIDDVMRIILNILKKVDDNSADFEFRRIANMTTLVLADKYGELQKYGKERELLAEAIKEAEALYEEYKSPKAYHDLFLIMLQYGDSELRCLLNEHEAINVINAL